MSPSDESVQSKPPPIVSLPPSYSPATEASTKRYLIDLASFLSSPFARALVDSHPNRAVGGVQGSGEELEDVWRWAGEVGVREKEEREEVLGKLCAGEVEQTAPTCLRNLLQILTRLSLPRDPLVPACKLPLPPKQSPKKAHEVDRLATLVASLPSFSSNPRIVDVGAGQGYLSRTLALPPYNCRVLGVDNNEHQTGGAESILKKTREKTTKGSISHLTAHIGDPGSLQRTISHWVESTSPAPAETAEPESVALVGLHACGPLSVNIIRTYLSSLPSSSPAQQLNWTPSSLALVGCCYNFLTSPSDLYLSSTSLSHTPSDLLTPDFLQLATRDIHLGPSSTPAAAASYRLSIKKMIWWSILDDLLESEGHGKAGERRIGKLEKGAFEGSWSGYVQAAGRRLGLDLRDLVRRLEVEGDEERTQRELIEFRLGVLHTLRCLLGPAIEALLLLDRLLYIHESLPSTSSSQPLLQGSLLPLFDRTTGSLRNMVLVISPALLPYPATEIS